MKIVFVLGLIFQFQQNIVLTNSRFSNFCKYQNICFKDKRKIENKILNLKIINSNLIILRSFLKYQAGMQFSNSIIDSLFKTQNIRINQDNKNIIDEAFNYNLGNSQYILDTIFQSFLNHMNQYNQELIENQNILETNNNNQFLYSIENFSINSLNYIFLCIMNRERPAFSTIYDYIDAFYFNIMNKNSNNDFISNKINIVSFLIEQRYRNIINQNRNQILDVQNLIDHNLNLKQKQYIYLSIHSLQYYASQKQMQKNLPTDKLQLKDKLKKQESLIQFINNLQTLEQGNNIINTDSSSRISLIIIKFIGNFIQSNLLIQSQDLKDTHLQIPFLITNTFLYFKYLSKSKENLQAKLKDNWQLIIRQIVYHFTKFGENSEFIQTEDYNLQNQIIYTKIYSNIFITPLQNKQFVTTFINIIEKVTDNQIDGNIQQEFDNQINSKLDSINKSIEKQFLNPQNNINNDKSTNKNINIKNNMNDKIETEFNPEIDESIYSIRNPQAKKITLESNSTNSTMRKLNNNREKKLDNLNSRQNQPKLSKYQTNYDNQLKESESSSSNRSESESSSSQRQEVSSETASVLDKYKDHPIDIHIHQDEPIINLGNTKMTNEEIRKILKSTLNFKNMLK